MEKRIVSRIHSKFTPDMLKKLNSISSNPFEENPAKVNKILKTLDEFLGEGNVMLLGPGTNRLAVLIDNYVYKIALDKHGYIDNWNELSMTEELQPYVIKVYESNGLLAVTEYVTVVSKEEFIDKRDEMAVILEDLSQSYLLGDVGLVQKNFLNWGYRDTGELVILDFAYIYRVRWANILCPDCDIILNYDNNYYNLVCPVCQRTYNFIEIRNRIDIEQEQEEIDTFKRSAYKLTTPEIFVEDGTIKEVRIEPIKNQPEENEMNKIKTNNYYGNMNGQEIKPVQNDSYNNMDAESLQESIIAAMKENKKIDNTKMYNTPDLMCEEKNEGPKDTDSVNLLDIYLQQHQSDDAYDNNDENETPVFITDIVDKIIAFARQEGKPDGEEFFVGNLKDIDNTNWEQIKTCLEDIDTELISRDDVYTSDMQNNGIFYLVLSDWLEDVQCDCCTSKKISKDDEEEHDDFTELLNSMKQIKEDKTVLKTIKELKSYESEGQIDVQEPTYVISTKNGYICSNEDGLTTGDIFDACNITNISVEGMRTFCSMISNYTNLENIVYKEVTINNGKIEELCNEPQIVLTGNIAEETGRLDFGSKYIVSTSQGYLAGTSDSFEFVPMNKSRIFNGKELFRIRRNLITDLKKINYDSIRFEEVALREPFKTDVKGTTNEDEQLAKKSQGSCDEETKGIFGYNTLKEEGNSEEIKQPLNECKNDNNCDEVETEIIGYAEVLIDVTLAFSSLSSSIGLVQTENYKDELAKIAVRYLTFSLDPDFNQDIDTFACAEICNIFGLKEINTEVDEKPEKEIISENSEDILLNYYGIKPQTTDNDISVRVIPAETQNLSVDEMREKLRQSINK